MKKLATLAGLTLLAFNVAYAAPAQHNFTAGACNIISPDGNGKSGSRFASDVDQLEAQLWFNAHNGKGVSGNMNAEVDGKHVDTKVFDSTCEDGHLVLRWNSPGFAGRLDGDIDGANRKIINVVGELNGKPLRSELVYKSQA